MMDYLFELSEFSENEGELIFCEAESLQSAWTILCWQNGFKRKELRYVDCYTPEEAEILGYDTY